MLRGGRDFASREQYEQFLRKILDKRNASRSAKFAEEQTRLGELPPGKLDYRQRVAGIRVRSSSTIQVKRNTYSVPSRLIGHKIDVVIDADFVEVWYADNEVQRMPRLIGSGKHAINYRHVIDSLVRKPGAFDNYQYRADMFPTSHFRIAYDALCRDCGLHKGVREYLKILQLAARESQDVVQDALRLAVSRGETISSKSVRLAVEQHRQAPPVTDVHVEPPDLNAFDSLLQHPDMEVETHEYAKEKERAKDEPGSWQAAANDGKQSSEGNDERSSENNDGQLSKNNGKQSEVELAVDETTDGAVSGAASADVPKRVQESVGACGPGADESSGILVGVSGVGMSGASGRSDHASAASVATAILEDVAQLPVEAASACGGSTDGESARRFVSGSSGEPVDFREAGFREEPLSLCVGRAVGPSRPLDFVHDQQPAGATVACSQAGLAGMLPV